MKKTGIIIIDRWSTRDGCRPLPASERCALEARFMVRCWDPDAPSPSNGRLGRYLNRCFASESTAMEWAIATRSDLVKGVASALRPLISTIGPAYINALKNRIGDKPVHPRHLDQVQRVVRDLTAIGADDMTDPRFPDRVQRWIGNLMAKRTWAKKAHPASGAYKRKLLVIARAFVHYAQKRRLIAYDPLAPLSIGRINTHRRPVFTIEELRKLVSDDASVIDRADRGTSAKTLSITHGNQEVAARYLGISPSTMSYRLSTPPKPDPWWPFACLVAYTGVRAGEARSITWSMVDWEAGVIRLPAEAQGNKMQRDRRIRIQPELKDILRGLSLKAAEIDTPIIGHEISGYDQHDIYDGFIRYCRRHGVLGKPRGPHTLRHSFCGLMTALGASPFLVMDAAGHSTTQISKHYCEAAEEYIDQIANWPRHHYWPEFQLRQSPPLVASLHQGNETVNHHPFHRFIG